jgi:hypothetical protein
MTDTMISLTARLAHAENCRSQWTLPPSGDEGYAFVLRAVGKWDAEIASLQAKIVAHEAGQVSRAAEHEAARLASLTDAARANPAAECYKCGGRGRINAFSHVSGGTCFACGGAGVRRTRRAA